MNMLRLPCGSPAGKSLCLILLMLWAFNLDAQSVAKSSMAASSYSTQNFADVKPLNIGDYVPDFEFELLNSDRKRAKLSDYLEDGKYIVLDFWATWCTSCLYKFPKLDSLQSEFENKQLQVLLVNSKGTGDNTQKISAFFEKRKNPSGKKYQLPSIINDSITDKLFPHKMIPHYVLIDEKGIVQAITSSDQITKENIQAFLHGEKLNLTVKEDLEFDRDKPFFVNGNGGSNEKYIYRSFLAGYLDGLPGISGTNRDVNNLITRIYAINVSILMLYQRAYPEMNNYSKSRIILNVDDPLKYHTDGSWDTWKYNNTYSYELIIPPSTMEEMMIYMRDDLKRFFGLNLYTLRKKVSCLVLKSQTHSKQGILNDSASVSTNIYEKDTLPKYLHNQPISVLVNFLNARIKIPVIDETNISKKVYLEGLPNDLTNIKSLKKALYQYGFDLTEEQRELEFLVLSE